MMGSAATRRITIGLAILLLAGCEPDDPAVRKELVEMRTALANTRQELDEAKAALAVAQQKAGKVDFLEVSQLSGKLEAHREELRAILIQAYPGNRVESLSVGAIETPLTAPAPYRASISFSLRQLDSASGQPIGDNLGPYTISIPAGRDGAWKIPTAAQLAALLGGGARDDSAQSSRRDTAQPVGAASDEIRTIEWGDGNRRQPNAPAPRAPAQRTTAPTPASPMESQETREIRFE